MNNRQPAPAESKEKEEKILFAQPASQLKIEDVLVRFLQKIEISRDRSYLSLVKIKKDFLRILKAQQNNDTESENNLREAFRTNLNNLMRNISHLYSVTVDDISFYDAILALVRFNPPINSTDPMTLDEIKPENQVRISDGYQFDVESLYNWIQSTPLESLVNPSTNVKLNEQDKQTILKAVNRYAERERKEVKILTGNPHLHGDPAYDATMALARELQQPQPVIAPPNNTGNRQVDDAYLNELALFLISQRTSALLSMSDRALDELRNRLLHESDDSDNEDNEPDDSDDDRPLPNTVIEELRNARREDANRLRSLRARALNTDIPYSGSNLHASPFSSALRAYGFFSPSPNRYIEETITALRSYGATLELLRTWISPNRDPFTSEHKNALIYLVTGQPRASYVGFNPPERLLTEEQRLTPEQAVQEINSLNSDQAKALLENYAFGLRGHHLREWQAPPDNSSFTLDHAEALKCLFRREHLSPEEAMARINGKNESEAFAIYRALNQPRPRI